MKKWNVLKTSLLLLLIGAAACRPEPFKEANERYDLVAGINGTWELAKVEVEDRSFPEFSSLDFSDFFAEQTITITFDAASQSYNFEGEATGLPFGSEGSYSFDDERYPTRISFRPVGGEELELELGNMVREIDPSMSFRRTRSSCDQVYAQYRYFFNRKN